MNTNAIIMNSKTKYKGKKKIKHNVTKKLKYMASMGGKSSTTIKKKKYSVSCDLSAAPAPGQSAGPVRRLALTEKDQSISA